jgi:hypothetical protein
MTTDYIAPLALWLVVRRHFRGDGSRWVEPAWVGNGVHSGPAVFVSRLHAHLYAALRNLYHEDDDTDNWQCIPLQSFDLLGRVRESNGVLNCEMTFGFACDARGALIIANGAPRLHYVELTVDLAGCLKEPDQPVFNFSQWAFDFMREQWEEIGARRYEASIERVEVMDDATFARTLDTALRAAALTRNEDGRERWTVYEAGVRRWIASPSLPHAELQTTLTLH